MKTCNTCQQTKPLTEFYRHRGPRTSEGYLNPSCKSCVNLKSREWAKNNPEKVKIHRRKGRLKQKYNISLEEYENLVQHQHNLCAVCLSQHKRRPLNVDHNHTTGQIRGLLCDKCNMALGLLNDNAKTIKALLNYRESYN